MVDDKLKRDIIQALHTNDEKDFLKNFNQQEIDSALDYTCNNVEHNSLIGTYCNFFLGFLHGFKYNKDINDTIKTSKNIKTGRDLINYFDNLEKCGDKDASYLLSESLRYFKNEETSFEYIMERLLFDINYNIKHSRGKEKEYFIKLKRKLDNYGFKTE